MASMSSHCCTNLLAFYPPADLNSGVLVIPLDGMRWTVGCHFPVVFLLFFHVLQSIFIFDRNVSMAVHSLGTSKLHFSIAKLA